MTLPQIFRSPGANVHGFSIASERTPGELSLDFGKIAEEHRNIISADVFALPGADHADIYLIVDFLDAGKGAKDFLSLIAGIPPVKTLTHVEPSAVG